MVTNRLPFNDDFFWKFWQTSDKKRSCALPRHFVPFLCFRVGDALIYIIIYANYLRRKPLTNSCVCGCVRIRFGKYDSGRMSWWWRHVDVSMWHLSCDRHFLLKESRPAPRDNYKLANSENCHFLKYCHADFRTFTAYHVTKFLKNMANTTTVGIKQSETKIPFLDDINIENSPRHLNCLI
jgi:hypothetical protein